MCFHLRRDVNQMRITSDAKSRIMVYGLVNIITHFVIYVFFEKSIASMNKIDCSYVLLITLPLKFVNYDILSIVS